MADAHYPAKPTTDELASFLRARTVDRYGNEIDAFTDATRPTEAQASQLIDAAHNLVSLKIGRINDLNDEIIEQAREVVKLLAARLVETVYYPEQAAQEQSAAALYGEMYDAAIASLIAAVEDNRGGTEGGSIASVPIVGLARATQDSITWPINPEQRNLDEPIDPYDPAWNPNTWWE